MTLFCQQPLSKLEVTASYWERGVPNPLPTRLDWHSGVSWQRFTSIPCRSDRPPHHWGMFRRTSPESNAASSMEV